MKGLTGCQIALGVFSLLFLLLALAGFIAFPLLFPTIVAKNLVLGENEVDGSLNNAAQLFSNPPSRNIMNFNFFNVTNQDEVMYEGAAPRVVEIGPYGFEEREQKRYMRFAENGTRMFYENYKMWFYNQSFSCHSCFYDDLITIPNPTAIGAAANMVDPQYGVSSAWRLLIAIGLVAFGELPFRTVRMGDLVFDGYDDPLLSLAHSPLMQLVSISFNRGKSIIPFPVPAMHTLAFFNGYNNTRDESYYVNTGKDDISKVGEIETWGGMKELPEEWWSTPQARAINGTDTGSFSKMQLTKDDTIQLFQSYVCRSFTTKYYGKREVEGIPSFTFGVIPEDFDTTLDQNRGFRYRNAEKVNYFPSWPNCPDYNPSQCRTPVEEVDCSAAENLCNDCCQRGKVHGTHLLPPGIFPLVCYPGRNAITPFAVLWSAPHFLFSAPEVINSIVGVSPNEAIHHPMTYDREPFSGMVTQVSFRMQINMPLFQNEYTVAHSNLRAAIVPLLYEDTNSKMKPFVYNLYYMSFVVAPRVVSVLRIVFLVAALVLAAAGAFLVCRGQQRIHSYDSVAAAASHSLSSTTNLSTKSLLPYT